MKQCPKCSVEHNKPGTYCCRVCANSRVWNEEDKLKKSISARNSGRLMFAIIETNKKRSEKALLVSKNIEKRSLTCNERRSKKFDLGLLSDASTIKKVLVERYGYTCMVCGIDNWEDKPLALQLDHIDGYSNNNLPSNVRLICPNCHSQTSTFGARNKGRGRAALRVRFPAAAP